MKRGMFLAIFGCLSFAAGMIVCSAMKTESDEHTLDDSEDYSFEAELENELFGDDENDFTDNAITD